MSDTESTTEHGQSTFEATSTSNASVESKMEEFNARMSRMIAKAEILAVREYQLDILPVLYQMNRANAGVQNELVKHHCPEDIFVAYTQAWYALKRLIWDIEKRRETTNEKED
jgi:molecular chaperone GrpE (heat shock protein)